MAEEESIVKVVTERSFSSRRVCRTKESDLCNAVDQEVVVARGDAGWRSTVDE